MPGSAHSPAGSYTDFIYYVPYESLVSSIARYSWKGKTMKPKKVLLTPEEQYLIDEVRKREEKIQKGTEALEAIRAVNPGVPTSGYIPSYLDADKPRLWTKQEILKVIAEQFPPAPKKRGFWS